MAQDQVWRLWVTVFLVWVRERRQSSVKMAPRRATARWRDWHLSHLRTHERGSSAPEVLASAVGSPLDYDAGSRSGILSP